MPPSETAHWLSLLSELMPDQKAVGLGFEPCHLLSTTLRATGPASNSPEAPATLMTKTQVSSSSS